MVIAQDLQNLRLIEIKRMIDMGGELMLNVFGDASIEAYGAVAYISNTFESNLVFSRARVAPLKALTLPQLELTALTMAVRIAKYVAEIFSKEVQFKGINIWSDSMISLAWLTCNKKLPTFVKNRVEEIKTSLPNANFMHVTGNQNPADLLSRGISLEKLRNNKVWWHGPTWIIGMNMETSIQCLHMETAGNIKEASKDVSIINSGICE